MSRWAERLKAKYASAEIAEIAETPPESPLEGSFGNSGNFGIGILPETDPAEWRGEYEAAEPMMAVRFWRHGEVFGPSSSALVPRGPLFDAADWLDDHGHGPVAIIEEQP